MTYSHAYRFSRYHCDSVFGLIKSGLEIRQHEQIIASASNDINK